MQNKTTALAQRNQTKIHFEHKDMDYYLSWVMGRAIYAGSDYDECLTTARRIADGDVESWQHEWLQLAERVAGAAKTHQDFWHACTYYRAALFIMPPQHPQFRETVDKMRACFLQAASRAHPPIKPITVLYNGVSLHGYWWQPEDKPRQRPTLIVVGGIETFAEDCYFMVATAGTARGFNLLTVDLPGQGLNPAQALYFRASMGSAVSAVVDYALGQPDTDPNRIALYGFSWGGHIAFHGAHHDTRIKAMIANPAMPDVFRAAWAQQGGQNRRDPVARAAFSQIAWRMGARISLNPKDIGRRFGLIYDYLLHGKVNPREVICPVLCLAGAGEAAITLKIAHECLAQLPHPHKKLVIFSRADGSEAHCQVDHLQLPNSVIFDWLKDVL